MTIPFYEFLHLIEQAGGSFAGAGVIPYCKTTGRYLFTQRGPRVKMPYTWAGFGGAIDQGETPAEAALREMAEEANFTGAMDLELIYVYDNQKGFKYFNFIGLVKEEFEPELNWENVDWKWVKPNDLPKPLHPGIEEMLKTTSL